MGAVIPSFPQAHSSPTSIAGRGLRPALIAALLLFLAVLPPLAGRSGCAAQTPALARERNADGRAFPGILLPGKTALIKSKRDETVAAVQVAAGERVHEGQLLLQLASSEEQVHRDRAQAVLKQAQADLDRIRRLHAENLAADDILESAELALSIAQADFDLARILLEESDICAPFAGVVTERYVDPGTSVEVGDNLLRVTALSPLRFEALLPETMLSALASRTVVELYPAYPDTILRLPVQPASLIVDPASGTFPLQFEVENRHGRLVPGVSCEVRLYPAPAGSR
jgi:RND family efflux transporter MFP subunit